VVNATMEKSYNVGKRCIPLFILMTS